MQTPKHDGNGSLETSEHVHAPENEGVEPAGEDRSDMVATVATVAVVGIAAAAFEAACCRVSCWGSRQSQRRSICPRWALP